jgi:putative DNA primase/helicase
MSEERERIWPERYPPALVAYDQWVLWRYEERDGKRTKVPYTTNGRRASSTDRASWASLDTVKRTRWEQAGAWDGIGFVFSPEDPFVGIDLDHARGETWALELCDQFATYYEITPSWTGYHLIGRGVLPATSGPSPSYSPRPSSPTAATTRARSRSTTGTASSP